MVPFGQSLVQISVPRGGSNAVARMLGQSPSIAAVVRSALLESGVGGFREAVGEITREAPERLIYIKEHAAFLSGERFNWFGPDDRFLLVVRDPFRQLASAVLAICDNPQLLRKKVADRRGGPVTDAEAASYLDRLATGARPRPPSTPMSVPGGSVPGGAWRGLVADAVASQDFRSLAGPVGELFDEQPERHQCTSDVEWFDRSLFQVIALSWTGAIGRAQQLHSWGAGRCAVVDFTVLASRPALVAALCERLEIQYHHRMATGPWQPPGRWFEAGLELADGFRWVDRARRSTVLDRPQPLTFDPLALPEPARAVLLPSLAVYVQLLRHPALVGPRSEPELRALFGEGGRRGHPGFLAGSPVTAWSLAAARTGVHSELTRAVERAHPGLARFFDQARSAVSTLRAEWSVPAYAMLS